MGMVGTRLHVFAGESGPSDAVEAWNEEGVKWTKTTGRIKCTSMKFQLVLRQFLI